MGDLPEYDIMRLNYPDTECVAKGKCYTEVWPLERGEMNKEGMPKYRQAIIEGATSTIDAQRLT